MKKLVSTYAAATEAPVKKTSGKLKIFNFILLAAVAGLGSFHLYNISSLTGQGFVLRELKSRVAALASEQLEYEERINVAQSYYNLSARSKNLNMVAIGEVEYLSLGTLAVAKK